MRIAAALVGLVAGVALFLVYKGSQSEVGAPPGVPAVVALGPEATADDEEQPAPAALAEPLPEDLPTIYRKVVNGEVVYEGDVPPEEALTGPPPIEKSAIDLPTETQLSPHVDRWLTDLVSIPITVEDLATLKEQHQAARFQRLRFVDDRYLVGLAFRGDAPDEDTLERLLDRYSELTHCLNRTEKTFSPQAMITLMNLERVMAIDAEIDALKAELRAAGLKSITTTTIPVSLETIYELGGSR